jgi:hypothetical protein
MTPSPLSAEILLRLWEEGESDSADALRAVRCLALLHPHKTQDELVQMSVGERDEWLLAVLERYRGPTLKLSDECSACGKEVEVAFDVRDLPGADRGVRDGGTFRVEKDSVVVDFRLPNSVDLEAARRCADLESARKVLLDRCVVEASHDDGSRRLGSALPVDVQAAVEREMDRLDPLAALEMDLECPYCAHSWLSRFDVAEVVWSEIADRGRRLLREIAVLARHYHWSERDIVRMSARRRRAYQELAEE